MPLQFIPFTTLAPDSEFGGEGIGLTRCENVIPALGGLRSLPKPTQDGTLSGRLNSCYVHHYPSNSGSAAYTGDAATEYFGSQTALYTYAGGTFTSRNGALVFGTGTSAAWRFASYGNDIWAANYTESLCRRTNNAGNFAVGPTSTFVPRGRLLGVVRDFLVCGGLGNAGFLQDTFAWADPPDATWWDDRTGARPASLAGNKPIRSHPGQLMAFIGGEFGTWWKRNSMYVMQLTGGDDVWRLDTVSGSVGTPCPLSVIQCRDGVRRFWGGDAFYAQAGMAEPQRIPSGAGASALLIDRDCYLNDVSLRALGSFNDMSEEDLSMFAVEDPELGGVFWFYRGEADDPAVGNNRWVYYNYAADVWALGVVTGVNFTCAATNRNFLSTATNPPRFIVGATYDASLSEAYHFRFQSATHFAITLATQRFTLGQSGAPGRAQYGRVNAIQPVVQPRQATQGTDYRLSALPQDMAFRLVAANDPHFQQQSDELGQVSPRSEALTVADANDYGWIGVTGSGRSFLLELSVPESSTAIRDLKGFWIDYEVVG